MLPAMKKAPGQSMSATSILTKIINLGDTIVHKDILGLSFVVVGVVVTDSRDRILAVEIAYRAYDSKDGDPIDDRTIVSIPFEIIQRDFNRVVTITESIG